MTKPVIVTRAGKGSALTWTEGDANLTNLQNATITVTDGTNSKALDLNSTLTFTAGSNITLSVNSTTGAVTINGSSGGISSVSADTNPSLGGDLSVAGHSIVSTSNGNINITPNGSGNINLTPNSGHVTISAVNFPTGDGTSGQAITTNGTGQLGWTTVSTFNPAIPGAIGGTTPNTAAFTVLSATATTTSGALNVTYNPTATSGSAIQVTGKDSQGGTGYLDFFKATNTTSGATNPNKTFRLTSTGTIEIINSGYSGNLLSLTDAGVLTVPNIVSSGSLSFKDTRETIYDLGTTGGTIAPNATNGTVQKITLNSALTLNAFTSPVAGQSITLIIYGGTSYTSITSTMKFAAGVKTLTATAGCIDILSIYYDGTNYFASLGKGYA